MRTDTPRPIRLKDYRPPTYLIAHVDLDVTLDAQETLIHAKLHIKRNPAETAKSSYLDLDGEGLSLRAIAIDGENLDDNAFTLTDGGLRLKSPRDTFVLETTVAINPTANKALQGLYLSRGIYCTQCEAQGFRRITYFLDRPDVLSTYTVRLEADTAEAGILLSNGNPLERGTLPGGKRHYAVWKDPFPKPCYLFALVGGNLASISSTFKTMSGRKVDLAVYVEPGNEERAGWAMESLKRSMAWDEQRFGREYDLDVFNIVAVSHFNMGAMENKGLNIFNDRLVLAAPDTATDAIYQSIEGVVAHEYFHNWTGNRITCRDWFQLCLKEGLTVYRDQEFTADMRVRDVQRIREVRHLRAHQFPEDAGPLAHPVRPESYIEINNFYTATVYDKGAEVIRMLATLLGQEGFARGMDLYFERHDGDAATIEDFIACFEDATEANLSQFRLWYHQAGTPHLRCQTSFDDKAGTLTIELSQETAPTPGQTRKKPFHIPVRFGFLDSSGAPITLDPAKTSTDIDGDLIHLTKKRQKFVFEGAGSKPVVSLLRGFSAPVVLDFNRADDELQFLAQNDTDGFNRWQAVNTLATRLLLRRVEALKTSERTSGDKELIAALKAALDDDTLQDGFKAELLKLPSETDIAREIGSDVDPALVYRAHKQLSALIGRRLGDELEAAYKRTNSNEAFSTSAEAMGRRALRNAALQLLTRRKSEADLKRLARHYKRATNMTDASQALFLLAGQSKTYREPALEHFHRKWKSDHLVIDIWFAAIAAAPRASVLADIKRAMNDKAFDKFTPNKVRALIGNFAMNNPAQFHRPDGKGYQFFADRIIELDGYNPQLAARLLGALSSWSSLEKARRKLARNELLRISRKEGISRDVYEIVTKMIEPPTT